MSRAILAATLSLLALNLAAAPATGRPAAAARARTAAPAHAVAAVTVNRHRPAQFDDTDIDVIYNGGDPNQVLCADRPIVGSRFIRHICYTRQQWAQIKFVQVFHTNKMMRRLGEDAGLSGDPTQPQGANNPN